MKELKTTVVYTKDGNPMIVNEIDTAKFIASGCSLSAPSTQVPPSAPDDNKDTAPSGDGGSDEGGNSGKKSVDYSQFTDEQLKEFAEKAGLPGTIKKAETIIEKLNAMGFDPAAE